MLILATTVQNALKKQKMEMIHLSIIEDDQLIRDSLESYFSSIPNIKIGLVADSVENFISALRVMRNPEIDVLLLDIGLPGISGLEGIAPIKRLLESVK